MKSKKKSAKLYAALLIAILAAVFAALNHEMSPQVGNVVSDARFEVHYIDVGQADSELVISNGHSMLIDGGNAPDSNLIVSYLRDCGINHLDYVICTHVHEDHVGGLAGALHECTADHVLCSTDNHTTKVFKNFKRYAEEQGRKIEIPSAGDSFELGESHVEILAPINKYDDLNNNSIVLRVTYGDTSFLFTGDAEREEEQDILNAGYNISADVLKVGHHGSSTSTSYPFLREVMPKYAVISCEKGNSYGHPHEETLSKLKDADAKVYRTDLNGHIIALSDGKNIEFQTKK